MGKKLFWSRDRLVKHEFDCFGLGLGLGLTGDTRKIFVSKTVDESNSACVLVGCKPIRLGLWIASGLWLGLGCM